MLFPCLLYSFGAKTSSSYRGIVGQKFFQLKRKQQRWRQEEKNRALICVRVRFFAVHFQFIVAFALHLHLNFFLFFDNNKKKTKNFQNIYRCERGRHKNACILVRETQCRMSKRDGRRKRRRRRCEKKTLDKKCAKKSFSFLSTSWNGVENTQRDREREKVWARSAARRWMGCANDWSNWVRGEWEMNGLLDGYKLIIIA